MQVKVWTVNDQTDMRNLIAMGVDGIISDYPNILRSVLKREGRSVPFPDSTFDYL